MTTNLQHEVLKTKRQKVIEDKEIPRKEDFLVFEASPLPCVGIQESLQIARKYGASAWHPLSLGS
jgi:hypothetical protein